MTKANSEQLTQAVRWMKVLTFLIFLIGPITTKAQFFSPVPIDSVGGALEIRPIITMNCASVRQWDYYAFRSVGAGYSIQYLVNRNDRWRCKMSLNSWIMNTGDIGIGLGFLNNMLTVGVIGKDEVELFLGFSINFNN